MTMISVCPEVSTLMDVGASPPGQRSTERFHSGLASCLCLQGGQCLPNWENCWQDKWSHRALDAADYTGTLQASKTNTGTRGHQSHLCSGTCSLHISLENLSLFLTTSGLEHWEKLGAEGEANLPKHSLILLALPAWWKRWRAVLRFQEDTSQPRAEAWPLPHLSFVPVFFNNLCNLHREKHKRQVNRGFAWSCIHTSRRHKLFYIRTHLPPK